MKKIGKFWMPTRLPPNVSKRVEPILKKIEFMIPGWCDHVYVYFVKEDKHTIICDMTSHYDYRWACLNLYLEWEGPNHWRDLHYLVHELIHIYTEPMIKKKKSKVTPEEERNVESTVEDLTNMIVPLLSRKRNKK